jgi:hypothetical protein
MSEHFLVVFGGIVVLGLAALTLLLLVVFLLISIWREAK